MQHKILVVDDEAANLRLLKRVLSDDYLVFTASDGETALNILEKEDINLIITDQRMPNMTGVELLQKSISLRPHAIKILLTGYTDIQSLIDAINQGHVYKYIQKPWDADELKITVKRALESFELSRRNEVLIKDLTHTLIRLEDLSLGVIKALADALDAKCDYTSGHSLRVSRFAVCIGKALELNDDELRDLELAGILHDVGKIGVPESILWKPSRLDEEEQKIMAQHPVRSAQIIGEIDLLKRARLWVLHHHEYLDGSGYPDKLIGDQIPLGSRIILVADAYDAMTSDRPYRKAIGYTRAAEELTKYSGKQFDKDIVKALIDFVGPNGEKLNGQIPDSHLNLQVESTSPLSPLKQFLAQSVEKAQP